MKKRISVQGFWRSQGETRSLAGQALQKNFLKKFEKGVDKEKTLCYTVSEKRQNSQMKIERGVKNVRNDQNSDEIFSYAVFDVPDGRIGENASPK